MSTPARLALLMLTVALANAAAAPAPTLQALVDATPEGGTLRVPPGRHAGPLRLTRPITVDGGGRAQVVGDGHGHVVQVGGRDVTLRGLHISASGDSHDRADSGVLVQGQGHVIQDNRLDDVLFGIHLQGASGTRVVGNQVRGKALPTGLRGDALRLWNSRGNLVQGNGFERARDLTLINSPDNRLHDNRFDDGRYGLHVVFSPRLEATRNRLTRTGTGIVVLYSPEVRLLGNHVAHALTDGGAGIVVKESDGARLEGNELLHNAVGLKLDAPLEGRSRLQVRGNHFAHNVVGLFFYGEAGAGDFADNRFSANLTPVAVSAPGAGQGYRWRRNRWDDYQGFDRDGDGIGDQPHDELLFADRIWMETPMAGFFRASPVLELLDLLERLAPFSAPLRVVHDPQPRVGAPSPTLETSR
ncbi:MAG: nitrous oxide reductase family maturation protein NosD [Rubrivivax sp.]